MTTSDVAVREDSPTVVSFLRNNQQMLSESLPAHLSSDRFVRLALTAMRKTPDLQRCTPQSFVGSLLTASALGLEPEVAGECYLVPYDTKYRDETGRERKRLEAQLIIGYQGVAKLFWQHPLARHLEAEAVHEADYFDWQKGTNPYLHFKPAAGGRGPVVAYYAVGGLSTGATEFVVLTPTEVQALRRGKVGTKGDIPDPQRWMERKTVLKQLLKLLPKSVMLAQALRVDEQLGTSLAAASAARAITQGEVMADLPPTPDDPGDTEIAGPLIPPAQ